MWRNIDLSEPATLRTRRLSLVPLGPEHFEGTWKSLADEEVLRLTGTHQVFTEEAVRRWLASLAGRATEAHWAITVSDTGAHIGEAVLNELDIDNASMNFRIALQGPDVFGRGYGTEATRAVVDHGLDVLGLHRIHLEVFVGNPRARRTYEKSGFIAEGRRREALHWQGQWIDAITMSILDTDPRPWRTPPSQPPDGRGSTGEARIPPLVAPERDERQAALVAQAGAELGVYTTLVRNADVFADFLPLGRRLLHLSTLDERVRELLILRVAWRCRARYVWSHHEVAGRAAGLTDDDLTALATSRADDRDPVRRLMIQVADELVADHRLGDPTWRELTAGHPAPQIIEICMLVGQYVMLAGTLNSLGVQIEAGYPVPEWPGN